MSRDLTCFPETMLTLWNHPPPVDKRLQMNWCDLVMSFVNPDMHPEAISQGPAYYGRGRIPDKEFRLANKCVAMVTQLQQFPGIDEYEKEVTRSSKFAMQATMLGSQHPTMIALMIMDKELTKVFQTYDSYLRMMYRVKKTHDPTIIQDPYPMSSRYQRRCVAFIHQEVLKLIRKTVTRYVSTTGKLSYKNLQDEMLFKSEYFKITIWNNIANAALEADVDFVLDNTNTGILNYTSNLLRDGFQYRHNFFAGRTPMQVADDDGKEVVPTLVS